MRVACKSHHEHLLSVKNHLDSYQRYEVLIDAPKDNYVVVDGMLVSQASMEYRFAATTRRTRVIRARFPPGSSVFPSVHAPAATDTGLARV